MAQIDTLTNVGAVVSTDLALILRGGANVLGTFGSLVGQNATAVTITGGTVNGTVIGGVTAAAGSFTTGAFSGGVDMASTLAVATRVGIGVAAHASAALNITTTDQHIRLNNGSEIAVIELDSDGELNIWAHGDGETINLKTGSGAGTNVLSVVGSNVILPDDGYFLFGDGTSGIQGNSSSDFLKFYTANIETLVLGSTGAATFSGSLQNTGDFANITPAATANAAVFGAVIGLSNGYRIASDASNNITYTWSDGAGNTAMTLDASGSLVLNNAGGDAQMYFGGTGGTTRMYLARSGGDALLWNVDSGAVRFGTNNAEVMRISNGNLLVGSSIGNAKLYVKGSGASLTLARLEGDTAGDVAVPALQLIKYDNNTTTSQILANFYVNAGATTQGTITANGANTAAFATFSDERLKENIADLPDQYNNIRALRPVEFDYIESEGGGHQVGFIAQEMQEVYPCCVGERPDGMLQVAGWSKTEARLVSALQSAMNKIDELTARIETLEGA